MLVVGLVDSLKQHSAGLLGYHIDIIAAVASAGIGIDKHAPKSLGHVKKHVPLLERGRQINIASRGLLALVGASERINAQNFVILPGRADQKRGLGGRPHHVDMILNDLALSQMRILCLDQTVCISRGISLVVKDPHLHASLFAFGQDHVQIRPPFGPAEIGMRAGFHAKRAAAALVNTLDLRRNAIAVCAMLPVKRKQIILFSSRKDVVKSCVLHRYASVSGSFLPPRR